MVGTFLEPSCGRRFAPIHSIPYSVAQPLERGSNNYYSIIQGGLMRQSKNKKSRDVTAFLYERLSRDDNLEGESYSIGNQ